MPLAWGHTRLLETDWRLITQESHCFGCGSVKHIIKFIRLLIENYDNMVEKFSMVCKINSNSLSYIL